MLTYFSYYKIPKFENFIIEKSHFSDFYCENKIEGSKFMDQQAIIVTEKMKEGWKLNLWARTWKRFQTLLKVLGSLIYSFLKAFCKKHKMSIYGAND